MEQTIVQNKLDWEKFKYKFHSSWWSKMQKVIEHPNVYEIFQKLKKDAQTQTIVPSSEDTFKSFQIDLSTLRVLMMSQDPYPQVFDGKIASNGRAFCCENYGKISPSLDMLYKAWEDDCYSGLCLDHDMSNRSLEYLEKQGVMLTNISLTTVKDKPGKHEDLWKPFWELVFEHVFQYENGLIIIALGKPAQRIIKQFYMPFIHRVFEIEHPSFAARNSRNLDHQKVFSKTNSLLLEANGKKIEWLPLVTTKPPWII